MAGSKTDIQLIELKDTIKQLNTTIAAQNTMIAALQKTIDDLNARSTAQQEQIEYLTRKLFGSSSEKRNHNEIEGQLSFFDEVEQEAEPQVLADPEILVKSHTRKAKTKASDKYAGLPTEEVVIDLPQDQQFCPDCNVPLVRIGKEYLREEIIFIPATMKRILYYTSTYKCPNCSDGKNGDATAFYKPDYPALMKHSPASPSLVAWVMYQKYKNALPLYRLEQDFRSQFGVEISRTTMANWIIYCSSHYFNPIYEYFHRELLKRKFLMADETRVQVLKEPGRSAESDSFMWLFRSGEDGLAPIILYGYTETRARYNAAKFLEGFEGYLETDGYQGYNKLPNVIRCSCWAHARRYFVDAVPKGKDHDLSEPAVVGIQFIDKLFYYDRVSRDRGDSYEKRYDYRRQKDIPVLEAFWSWINNLPTRKGTRLDKAKNYVLSRKEELMNFLLDGHCSLSNNLSENAIRPFTVGRKNWLFSDTPKGAEASAVVYTMVEMAKANNLNVFKYLNYLLVNRPDESMTDEQLGLLAPWSEAVIDSCKN